MAGSVLRHVDLDAARLHKTFAHLGVCERLSQGSRDPALGPWALIARDAKAAEFHACAAGQRLANESVLAHVARELARLEQP